MRKILWIAGLLLAAVTAHANPVDVTLLSFSGGAWQNGYPYYLSFGPSGALQAAMCDDYLHGGSPGMSWQGNVTILGSNDLSLARFNQLPNALTLYDEAGWLLLQTVVVPTNQWKDMSYAVWHIFDPALPINSNAQSWLNAAIAEAGLGFPGVNFNEVDILTPVNQYDSDPRSPQEFLYLKVGQGGGGGVGGTTPEPASIVLLGTGALALFSRKFFG